MSFLSKHIPEMKVTQFWAKDLPSFRVEVPDSGNGIYMGSAVVDAVISSQMRATLEAAENKFNEIRDKKES